MLQNVRDNGTIWRVFVHASEAVGLLIVCEAGTDCFFHRHSFVGG